MPAIMLECGYVLSPRRETPPSGSAVFDGVHPYSQATTARICPHQRRQAATAIHCIQPLSTVFDGMMMPTMGSTTSGQQGQNATTPTKRKGALPTPDEVYEFLTRTFKVHCQKPSDPFVCPGWQPTSNAIRDPVFSSEFIRSLCREYRIDLLAIADDGLRPERRESIIADRDPNDPCPSSEEMFRIAGALIEPHHRYNLCECMAGLTESELCRALNINRTRFSLFTNGHVANHSALQIACTFLGVDIEWVRHGPQVYSAVHTGDLAPWWLLPWRLAHAEANWLFARAIDTDLLRKQDGVYDFAGFWSAWQNDPDRLRILPPEARAMAELHHADDTREKVTQASYAQSMLPWMFACAPSYDTGGDAFAVTMTCGTMTTLEWVMRYFVLNPPLKQRGHTMPNGPVPTEGDVMNALSLLPSGILTKKKMKGKETTTIEWRVPPLRARIPAFQTNADARPHP